MPITLQLQRLCRLEATIWRNRWVSSLWFLYHTAQALEDEPLEWLAHDGGRVSPVGAISKRLFGHAADSWSLGES